MHGCVAEVKLLLQLWARVAVWTSLMPQTQHPQVNLHSIGEKYQLKSVRMNREGRMLGGIYKHVTESEYNSNDQLPGDVKKDK